MASPLHHMEHDSWHRHPLGSALLSILWGTLLIVGVLVWTSFEGVPGEVRAGTSAGAGDAGPALDAQP